MIILPYTNGTTQKSASLQTAKRTIIQFFKKKGLVLDPRKIQILKLPSGQPTFKIAGYRNINPSQFSLSISHTKDYAAAEITDIKKQGLVGIDLEIIRQFSPLVYKSFLTEKERAWLASLPTTEQNKNATLIWSSKEAYLKAIGTGLRIHPSKLEIRSDNRGHLSLKSKINNKKTKLWYGFIDPRHVVAKVNVF